MRRLLNVGAGLPVIGAGVPVIDVAETNDAIELTAELPGVDEKDIKVSLDGNRLVISGEKKKAHSAVLCHEMTHWTRHESHSGDARP